MRHIDSQWRIFSEITCDQVRLDDAARAPADGYTLMLTLSLTHTTVPMLQSKVPYDPLRDFQPLTQIATGGPMLVVPAAPAGGAS